MELVNLSDLAVLACTLPDTEELLRTKLAPFCTLIEPLTAVEFRVQVAPLGTVKLPTALLLIVLVQFAAKVIVEDNVNTANAPNFKNCFFIALPN